MIGLQNGGQQVPELQSVRTAVDEFPHFLSILAMFE
jgi:hypothetical protein